MPIDSKTFESTGYGKVYRCVECGHGSVFPQPTVKEVAGFYALSAYYTQGASHMPTVPEKLFDKILTKLAWTFDNGKSLDLILDQMDLNDQSSVCEIGAGHGQNLVNLQNQGHKVVGVDPDRQAIDQAAKNNIKVLIGTGENLPEEIQSARFDLVIMSHSLEHCIDPILALSNAVDILRCGARLICEVPNTDCKHFVVNNICSEMFDAPRHLHFYNTNSLLISLKKVGLKIDSINYTGFTRHHSPSWRKIERELYENLARITKQIPSKHTYLRSMLLWLTTFAAPAKRKYDCVRIIASKTEAS